MTLCVFTNLSSSSLLRQEKLNGSKYSAFIISICQVVKLNTLKNKQRCNIIQFRGLQGGYVNIVSSKMAPPNCKSSLLTLNITSATADVMPGELSLSQKKEKSFLMVLKCKTISIFYSSQVAIIFQETLSKKWHPVLPSDFKPIYCPFMFSLPI